MTIYTKNAHKVFLFIPLIRRSVGLQSIAHTVRTSWKDLGLLFSLVAMGMLGKISLKIDKLLFKF